MAKTDAFSWMPMNWAHYLQDTMHLEREDHGSYLLLIAYYWNSRGPIDDDDRKLSAIAKVPAKKWPAARKILEPFFRVADGKWHHKRVDKELAEARRRRDHGRKGAGNRWAKDADEPMPEQCPSNARAMPEHPSSIDRASAPALHSTDTGLCTTSLRSVVLRPADARAHGSPPSPWPESDITAGFAELWEMWPKHRRGNEAGAARLYFLASYRAPSRAHVTAAAKALVESHEWRKEGGQYAWAITRWLEQDGWKNVPLNDSPKLSLSDAQRDQYRSLSDGPGFDPSAH